MTPQVYEFCAVMAVLFIGGAVTCLVAYLVERWMR